MHVAHMTAKWMGRSSAVRVEDPDALWKAEVDWEFGEEKVPTSSWVRRSGVSLTGLDFSANRALFGSDGSNNNGPPTPSHNPEHTILIHPYTDIPTPTSKCKLSSFLPSNTSFQD